MICPLCNASEIKYLFSKDAAAFMRCSRCGFEFANVTSNANFQNMIEDYDEAYVQYLEKNAADEKNFQSVLKWIGSYVDITKAKVLDVGCGSGKFVRYLRGKSIDASGIEPSKTLYDCYLSEEIYFQNSTVESLLEGIDGPYTVITILDVLEHVENPKTFIMALKKILANGGYIFLVTPDVGSVTAKIFGRYWHFYHRYHLSYFSKKTFSQFCEMQGFEVISWRKTAVYFSIGYVIRYICKFISQRSVASVAGIFDRFCVPLKTCDRFGVCLCKIMKGE